MEINTSRLFSTWGPEERERIVASGFPQKKDADPYIERIDRILLKKQFETGHFYDLKVVDVCENERQVAEGHRKERQANLERVDLIVFRVTLVSCVVLLGVAYLSNGNRQKLLFCAVVAIPLVAYPLLKSYGRSYYPEKTFHCERKETPYDLVLFRKKVDRTIPSNFEIEKDRDPFTLDSFTEERLQSPAVIYLPNYVVSSKEFVRSALEKGTIRHTLDNRDFSHEELKGIVDQISQIFRMTPAQFWSCFDLASADQDDKPDERGLDSEGKYTDDAKSAIAYSIAGIRDSSLPEIDELIDQYEEKVTPLLGLLSYTPRFQHYISQLSSQTSIDLSGVGDFLMNSGFPLISPLLLRTAEEDQSILFPVVTLRMLTMILLKNHGPEWSREQVKRELNEEKEMRRRETRLKILSITLFNRDMRKSDRQFERIKHFEALTGVSLSEIEDVLPIPARGVRCDRVQTPPRQVV